MTRNDYDGNTMGRRTIGRRGSLVLLASAMGLAGGCGYIDAPQGQGAPLWVLEGRILESADVPDGPLDLRVALVWEHHYYDGGVARIAQDVAINPEFPSRFTLELFEPPPEEAMHTPGELGEEFEGANIRLAAAQILVYDDLNGNGRLDVLAADAEVPIDYLLGSAEDFLVVYVEGDPAGLVVDDVPFETGMNLYHFLPNDDGWAPNIERIALDAGIEITIEDDPRMQHLMCDQPVEQSAGGGGTNTQATEVSPSNGSGSTGSGSSGTVEPVPGPDGATVPDVAGGVPSYMLPDDAEVVCDADNMGFVYSYSRVEHDGGVCSPIYESAYSGIIRWDEAEYGPVPADWPCG